MTPRPTQPPYPEHRIHTYRDGTRMRSKSELLCASILDDLKRTGHVTTWVYEQPVRVGKRWAHPDFTVRLPGGKVVYWEHTGRVDDFALLKAESKATWYEDGGVEAVFWTFDGEEGNFDMIGVRDDFLTWISPE